ncbi:PH domain-containing protein [Streptomyces sp. 110]|uniref:PH domain-containing protein n=1 Tax=Streptomyces endocoffeicus TaxID=2898945 RepID=A0ABS1PT52_9ACTN|nr:PH domain-containing protein [Streptomyces endocoffeicus]MBL1115469.1 PH domain-containing protein [Streptomyces endocoffeicus]
MTEPLQGRLHPVTPLRRSWAVLVGIGILTYNQRDLFSVGTSGTKEQIDVPVWAACAIVTVLVGGVVSLFVAAWWHSHYSLDGDTLGYRSGLLFKVRRHCDLDHVQSVDIVRPFLGRLIGVCTLRVVMSGTTMTLSYLTLNQARTLKARILAEDTSDEKLYQVKTKDLVLALLLDIGTNVWSLVLVAFGILPYVLSGELLTLSTLIAFVPKVWRLTGKRLFVYTGWSVTRTAEGSYRTDYGMFDTQQYTYRDSRIASIETHQPLLWRRLDWVEVKVAVAGAAAPGLLVPVCPRSVAEKMVLHLLGAEAVSHLHEPVPAPAEARKATPFYKALGYRLDNGFFTSWRGFFLRNVTTVAPVGRIQSVSIDQGPWQRKLGLASVYAHMAGGNSVPAAHRTNVESADLATCLYEHSMDYAEAKPGHQAGLVNTGR